MGSIGQWMVRSGLPTLIPGLLLASLPLMLNEVVAGPLPSGPTEIFSGSSRAASLGGNPALCNDPQIAGIEARSKTTARVFGGSSGDRNSARIGRWLEQNGYVYHTGGCKGQPGRLVMFIYNNRLADAIEAADQFASSSTNSSPTQNPPQGLNDDQFGSAGGITGTSSGAPLPGNARQLGIQAARQRCQKVWRQQGSFRGFPSCQAVMGSHVPAPIRKQHPSVCSWISDLKQRGICEITAGPLQGSTRRNVIWTGEIPLDTSAVSGTYDIGSGFPNRANQTNPEWIQIGSTFHWGYIFLDKKNRVYFQVLSESTMADAEGNPDRKAPRYARFLKVPLTLSPEGAELLKSGIIDPVRWKFLPNDQLPQ